MQLCQFVDPHGKSSYSLLPMIDIKNVKENEIKSVVKLEVGDDASKSKFYFCKECNLIFQTQSLLKQHQLTHRKKSTITMPESIRYWCSSCDFQCNSEAKLSSHVESNHNTKKNTSKKFSCTSCDFTCLKQKSLEAHAWKHASKEKVSDANKEQKVPESFQQVFVEEILESQARMKNLHEENLIEEDDFDDFLMCGECNFGSYDKEDLYRHLKRHQRKKLEPRLSCSQCDFYCTKKTIMLNHVTKEHQTEMTQNEPERCNYCDFTCQAKNKLLAHKRHHRVIHYSKFFTCDYCGLKATKKTSIYTHITRQHLRIGAKRKKNRPEFFFCPQCDYKNKSKYELKIHVTRKHTDDYKFPCEHCVKKFKVKGDLTNHVRFSHREQPVICDVCGKTCMNSNSLYVHQKFAHYKAKYECHVCKRRMVSQENLDEHLLKQHEQREIAVCEECGKTFTRNSRLKIHMRIHTGDKPYSCKICKKAFARRTALKQHLLIHTGVRPYVCDICGKAFTQKPGLISHRKSHPGSHPPLPRVLIDHILSDVMNS